MRRNSLATGKNFFHPLSNNIAWGTSAKKILMLNGNGGMLLLSLLSFAKIHLKLIENWLRYNSPKTQ